ncbi:hypothetical protein UVI_02006100 [Ustilaginoidea virens]|uniref:PH domain-containing protein n=1 Tax=Ustilaginoidea virens TaxID=1159556 RepID=A0A1B5L8S4_USTVR|nr:hypothetical protein UVI_02006100 [Ustilaginoidea virens]
MASSLAPDKRPDLRASGNGDVFGDPFVTTSSVPAHHRFSNFDQELFAAGPGSSPTQAKRALEAHLAETDRRLDEAGKLGTALVSQRKLLAEQLQQVQKLQAEGELGPELRQKLVDIEREYNDLARESARVFLPKQRVPSNEAHAGSPFVPDGRSGRRSVSPSKFESQATGSPTKLGVPNRKLRNQPSNRVHDIEFAAEISTSLIAQVRNLQTLLSERDDELKGAQSEKTRLEIDLEGLQQRLKALDESEHRYKEENWNLETRLQEITTQQREAADREKKLTQALNLSNSSKSSTQKELDDAKLTQSKLTEQHAAAVKHLDIELGTAKRNMAMVESERAALQRKIDDLTNQNQELAKVFSLQRGRTMEREPPSGLSDDDFETAADNITPEHSPPPSPVKGTPRHTMLETETIKSSLHHAQRTIQSQRSQLHREKTEKLELRRIIQDLRDDLEKARAGDAGGASNPRRSRKTDTKEFKKPARLLGSLRSSRQEILVDDPDWEDNPGLPPTRGSRSGSRPGAETSLHTRLTDSSDHFDTANEASESAFETANERATETEDFQTGNEALSGSDDDNETETESACRGFGRMKRPPSLPAGLVRANNRDSNRDSFDSTASTSADEDEVADMRTPTGTISSQRSRFRLSRGPFSRSSRQNSEEPASQRSPASHTSGGTPQAGGQSLFAELQDFGSDDDSLGVATPSRRSVRSVTPGSTRRAASPPPAVPNLPKIIMVDSGAMTDPVTIVPQAFERAFDRPMFMDFVARDEDQISTTWPSSRAIGPDLSRPASMLSYSDASIHHEQDMDASLAQFPVPPMSPCPVDANLLGLSQIQFQHIEPRELAIVPPTSPILSLTSLLVEHVEPREEIILPPTPPTLSLTPLIVEHVEPREEAEVPPPLLTVSRIATETLEPVMEPDTPRPCLTFSSVVAETSEPLCISVEHTEPVQSSAASPTLGFSIIKSIETRPLSPRSPRRDAFIIPKDYANDPETPPSRLIGSVLARGRMDDMETFIAEDETRQSRHGSPETATPESQRPFKEISANSNSRLSCKQSAHTSDRAAQTALTADSIDRLLKAGSPRSFGHVKDSSVSSVGSPETTGTVRRHRSQESFGSPVRLRAKPADETAAPDSAASTRPGSATSGRTSAQNVPPLPSNHREMIEAARTTSSHSQQQGSMGPPLWPASATKPWPQTPSPPTPSQQGVVGAGRGNAAPRAAGTVSIHAGTVEMPPPGRVTSRSRRSSVSSFASEIDSRFNMRPGEVGTNPNGFGPNTDPRMIQAITQTMIGEFLWKYTRKTGRGELSENRHRRYFWVHPYTRTLYWSDRDPSTAGRAEARAKSVSIEAVRVVTDDNPMPPGLHRKSLIIISPGRTIKFTCTTGQRHETWFNALSYLLLRTAQGNRTDAEEMAGQITQEDVDEFNPSFGRAPGNDFVSKTAPSLSSYHSHTTRNESPALGMSMNIPTLTPSENHKHSSATGRTSAGTLSKLSGYWRSGAPKITGTLTGFRGRGASSQNRDIYEASEAHDSAEDVREIMEQQDRGSDRLENVRACCDGRHDVGSLPHTSRRGRNLASHSHPGHSVPDASLAPMRSRA